jgi:hypothetical protein
MIPKIIKISPTTFPIVSVSLRIKTPKIKTIAGERLVKGYAVVNSILDIASVQKTDAIKADTNPEKTNGSKSSPK